MDEIEQDKKGFFPIYGIAQICGILSVFLMGIWMGNFRGGFAWQSDPSHQFNWHPLLMTIGLVYLYGNEKLENSRGILTYRILRNERKRKLKLAHAFIMLLSLLLVTVGLKAVFDSHNLAAKPIPNLYSIHSWIGLTTVILFAIQWSCGFVAFLFPGLASHMRALYLPVHVFFGLLIFVLACISALLGITEKLFFISGEMNYSGRSSEGVMVNFSGLFLLLWAIFVVYLARNPNFKRINRSEDELLLGDSPAGGA